MSEQEAAVGEGPIVATAIHAGHDLRPEIAGLLMLPEPDRLREEDPFTDQWLWIGDQAMSVPTSRFEVDLNRPRSKAVYQTSDDAWGLQLWREALSEQAIERSLSMYDAFYTALGDLLDGVATEHERFVLLDLHSYNHRRGGPDAPVDDPELNPEINVGTGSLDRQAWSDVVVAFTEGLAGYPFDGGNLDVRENVRFKGGHMSAWINDRYAGRGCALAVEVKKFYMDEWTGEPDEGVVVTVGDALAAAAGAVRDLLDG
jgi:N-formylglutamate amidohydrolase